jgi:hypothetical protein
MSSQNSRNQGFSCYFCFMIDGSGAGAGPRSNESGSGRSKNIRFRKDLDMVRDIYSGFRSNIVRYLLCARTLKKEYRSNIHDSLCSILDIICTKSFYTFKIFGRSINNVDTLPKYNPFPLDKCIFEYQSAKDTGKDLYSNFPLMHPH